MPGADLHNAAKILILAHLERHLKPSLNPLNHFVKTFFISLNECCSVSSFSGNSREFRKALMFLWCLSPRWVREFLNEENKGLDVLVEYLSFAQYAVT